MISLANAKTGSGPDTLAELADRPNVTIIDVDADGAGEGGESGGNARAVGTNLDRSDEMAVASSESTPPVPSADMVVASSESTPPGPPSRGGESGAAESAGLVGPGTLGQSPVRPLPAACGLPSDAAEPGQQIGGRSPLLQPDIAAEPHVGAGSVRRSELPSHDDACTTRRMHRGSINGIGLVGPMSNYATPPQLVEEVSYRDLGEMPAFARKWRDEHLGQWFTVPKLSGFCLLMKRAVYDKIGGLDERFGLGFFDDDDLAERAKRAGFETGGGP